MAEQQNMNMVVNPNEQMVRYMEISNGFMQGLTRQLDTNDVASSIPVFSGGSAQNFREWMRCLDRTYVDHENDHCFMRKLISKTTRDLAADYYADLKRDNDNDLTWPETRNAFCERFSNYVDAQIAQQKLKKLKQERKQGLHSFAQSIQDTAREAYTPEELQNPLIVRELKNVFIDGLRDHKTAQSLIREDVPTLHQALQRAIRDDLLQQTYRLRQITTDHDNRKVEHMEIDHIEKSDQNIKDNGLQEQISELTASVAAIAAAVNRSQHNNNRQGPHVPQSHVNNNRQDVNHAQPRYNYPNSKPRFNSYQQHSGSTHNATQYTRPNREPGNYNKGYQNSSTFQSPRLQWANNGDPICFYCGKQGHIARQCWTKHPEMRPVKNNNNRSAPQHAEN